MKTLIVKFEPGRKASQHLPSLIENLQKNVDGYKVVAVSNEIDLYELKDGEVSTIKQIDSLTADEVLNMISYNEIDNLDKAKGDLI